jgi:site-specific recombinase XerD
LPESEVKKSFRVIQACGDLQHETMLKLLFFTAVRVSKLVCIKVEDVDFEHCKIFIAEGKGRKGHTRQHLAQQIVDDPQTDQWVREYLEGAYGVKRAA